MSQTDLIGTQAVCDFIRASHMAIYYIHRYPSQSGQLPTYEYLKGTSPEQAAQDFQKWSAIINAGQRNTIQYQITVTNIQEGEEVSEVKKRKVQKMRASFVFNNDNSDMNSNRRVGDPPDKSYFDIQLDAIKKELKLEARIRELEDTVEDLEDELDEVEELGGMNTPQNKLLSKLVDKLDNEKKTKKVAASVSSPGNKDEILKSLNKSIKILLKHDPELDTHLAKLAKVAVEKPTKFKMLLNLMDDQL